MADSNKILYGRYKGLLNELDVELVCDYLVQRDLLTSREVESVLTENEDAGKKRQLARTLCYKGSTRLMEISGLLRKFKQEQSSLFPPKVAKPEGKVELLRRSPRDSPMMAPFIVLFSTFITQLKLFLTDSRGPSWLTDDVHQDSIADYFPLGAVRSVSHKSVTVRLSVLLEAFQQFVGSGSTDLHQQVQDLQRMCEKSEERCKQLVVVTQQWALECGDKDKAITIYETEVKQLKATIDQLEKRVSKYKRFWQDNRSGDQFEEIRTELAERKELCARYFDEKTKGEKQIQQLTQENKRFLTNIETLKDHLAEAEDRLGNMKLQATVKEPTVREMSKLVANLRECQSQNQQLLEEKKHMEDQILALQITLDEFQGANQAPPRPPPSTAPQPKPVRTQAMVTGIQSRQFHHNRKDVYSPRLDGVSNYSESVQDDTESTSSEETLPSSDFHSSRSVDLDPPTKSHESNDCDSFSVGLPDGDYTLGTRYPNHSSIKVAPLDNELFKYEGVASRAGRSNDQITGREKICPVCRYSFMALSEREFQTHVAGCFK